MSLSSSVRRRNTANSNSRRNRQYRNDNAIPAAWRCHDVAGQTSKSSCCTPSSLVGQPQRRGTAAEPAAADDNVVVVRLVVGGSSPGSRPNERGANPLRV